MRYFIVTGGEIDKKQFQKVQNQIEEEILYIGVDSGANFLYQMGIIPQILLGDFDSIDKNIFSFFQKQSEINIFRFPAEKDKTDTCLALDAVTILVEKGLDHLKEVWKENMKQNGASVQNTNSKKSIEAPKVDIFGGIGSRLDHSFSNLYLSFDFLEKLEIIFWHKNSKIEPCQGPIEKMIEKDENFPYISFLPISENVLGFQLEDFKYPLKDTKISQKEASLLVSNEIHQPAAKLSFREGKILIIKSRD